MFCKKCGNQIEEGAKFCKKCGTPVEGAAGMAAVSVPQAVTPAKERYMRIAIAAAGLLMALAAVLPYMVIDRDIARYIGIESISLLKPGDQIGDGLIYIILAVLVVVFVSIKKKAALLVCSVIAAVMFIYEAFNIKRLFDSVRGIADVREYISNGIGFYLMLVSVTALLGLSVLYYMQDKQKH